jgi:hypothetical protein
MKVHCGSLPVDDDQHVGGFAIGMEDEAIFLGFRVNQSGSDRRWTDSQVDACGTGGCRGLWEELGGRAEREGLTGWVESVLTFYWFSAILKRRVKRSGPFISGCEVGSSRLSLM